MVLEMGVGPHLEWAAKLETTSCQERGLGLVCPSRPTFLQVTHSQPMTLPPWESATGPVLAGKPERETCAPQEGKTLCA